MRLVVLSDTHGLHNKIEGLPAGDVLVHAGDFMNSGYDIPDIVSFKDRLVCSGNHDRLFEAARSRRERF